MNGRAAVASRPQIEWQVPSYQACVFRQPSSRFCIGIPVINEGERLRRQLDRMRKVSLIHDVLIADGGSTDGSVEPEFLADCHVRAVLTKTGPGKLSAQMRMVFAYAMEAGYEGIVLVDGNNKDGVESIPAFTHKLEEGYDFVQGSRYLPGGGEANTPLDRKIGGKFIHAPLLSLAAGFRYTDTTNGFRAYSRRFLLDPGVQPFRDVFDTYNLHYYLSIRAPRLGFRVCELPVSRTYPAAGPTPSKISGLRGKAHILRLLFEAVTGGYNPR